jgi:hypothetical protein
MPKSRLAIEGPRCLSLLVAKELRLLEAGKANLCGLFSVFHHDRFPCTKTFVAHATFAGITGDALLTISFVGPDGSILLARNHRLKDGRPNRLTTFACDDNWPCPESGEHRLLASIDGQIAGVFPMVIGPAEMVERLGY